MELAARLAADLVLFIHAAFVAFVLFGQVLILVGGLCGWHWVRGRRFRYAHLACIAFVVLESWCGVVCPLTTLETALRERAGEVGYRGDFIAYWVHRMLFYTAEPWVFTVCYTVFGALVAGSLWFVPIDRSKPKPNRPA